MLNLFCIPNYFSEKKKYLTLLKDILKSTLLNSLKIIDENKTPILSEWCFYSDIVSKPKLVY
jgi:hypothetical protein